MFIAFVILMLIGLKLRGFTNIINKRKSTTVNLVVLNLQNKHKIEINNGKGKGKK
jgi:hypothetical protein